MSNGEAFRRPDSSPPRPGDLVAPDVRESAWRSARRAAQMGVTEEDLLGREPRMPEPHGRRAVERLMGAPVPELLASAERALDAKHAEVAQLEAEVRHLERRIEDRIPDAMPAVPVDPTPGTMPRFRNYLARHALDQDERRWVNVSELYWIAPPMVDLAEAAATSLPDYDAAWDARPSDYGLAWLGRRLVRRVREESVDIGAVALRWRPRGDGFQVQGYVRAQDGIERLVYHETVGRGDLSLPAERDAMVRRYMRDAMAPGGTGAWHPGSADPITIRRGQAVDPQQPLAVFVAAAWLLMGQTLVTESRRADVDEKIRREFRRDKRPLPTVTIIDLRRAKGEPSGGPSGREYHHQWMVSGHWRNQACGPARSKRRLVWVSPHVKGPEGAPLLVTEKVRVWRR